MALADTAKLVASLELQDKFSKNADKFNQAVGGMERRVSTFGRISGQVGQGISTGVANLQRLALVGVGVIGANVAAGIQSLVRLEEVTAATNAVIESTGGAAGVTAEKVRELAEAYEAINATIDDKVIQSAENLLLTFPAVTEKAFEPALEAALNLNQALGGGEEGLQNTILQIGKALQDPVRGLTALRRSGVSFTKAQQDQIKALVEANDLYGAQTIILGELSRQFGGQFAAAGDTAAGKFAKLKDTIEDTQMALATAFLPVLEKVADKLTVLLADPATQAAIADVGENLADAFDSLVEVAGNLPWESIGNTFKLMGTGSKALLDAFVGLPPWVQTAVLTGWGLNKLTGGALTGIAGTIASALLGTRGSSPANPVFVSGGGVGGPGGVAGGGASTLLRLLGVIGAALGGTVIGSTVGNALNEPVVSPSRDFEADAIARALESGSLGQMAAALAAIQGQLTTEDPLMQAALLLDVNGVRTTLEQQRDLLREEISRITQGGKDTQARLREGQSKDQQQTQQLTTNLGNIRSEAIKQLQAQQAANVKLQQISAKDFSPTVAVTVTSNVSISDIQRRITSQQIAIGRGFQEFE